VAVVTGAGSGIGRALAIGFAKSGWRMALADVNTKGLDETVSMLQWPGSGKAEDRVYTQKLDVADRAAVHTFAEKVIAKFGAPDAVINKSVACTALGCSCARKALTRRTDQFVVSAV